MEPWLIITLTIACIIGVILLIQGSFWLLNAQNDFMLEAKGHALMKCLLFLPWIGLTLWCIVLHFLLVIVAVFTGYQIAVGVRNWMHKGHRYD